RAIAQRQHLDRLPYRATTLHLYDLRTTYARAPWRVNRLHQRTNAALAGQSCSSDEKTWSDGLLCRAYAARLVRGSMVAQTLSAPGLRTHLCFDRCAVPRTSRWNAFYVRCWWLFLCSSPLWTGLRVILRSTQRLNCWNTAGEKGQRAQQVVLATHVGTYSQSTVQWVSGRSAYRTTIWAIPVATTE